MLFSQLNITTFYVWCQYDTIHIDSIVVSYKCKLTQGRFHMSVIKSQFTLRLDLIDHAKIKKIAEEENRSMTNMIETLVKQEIKRYEKNNGEIILNDYDLSLE